MISTGQGILGNNMFAYCQNNPVNRFDPTGTSWESAIWKVIGDTVDIAQTFFTAVAKSIAKEAASVTKTTPYIAGGIYRAATNGLANSYTAMSNSLSAGASVLKGVGIALLVADCGISIYNNFTNDDLTTRRKITDSVVDVGVSIGTFVGTAAVAGSIGGPVGALAGIAVGTVAYVVTEYTPVVGWIKDGVDAAMDGIGKAVNAVGDFFGGLFK